MTYWTAHPAERHRLRVERESTHFANIAKQDARRAEFQVIEQTIVERLGELAELGHAASPGFIRQVAEDAARVIRASRAKVSA